jgi:hypothetical protein
VHSDARCGVAADTILLPPYGDLISRCFCYDAGAPHGSPTDADSQWQYANIVDKGMMGRAAMKVLDGSDLKIGVASLNLLSSGIQMHLKNVLDGAFRLSRSRMNQTAIGSYTSELTMCLCLRCSGWFFHLSSVI